MRACSDTAESISQFLTRHLAPRHHAIAIVGDEQLEVIPTTVHRKDLRFFGCAVGFAAALSIVAYMPLLWRSKVSNGI
jgi:hypothetical protein